MNNVFLSYSRIIPISGLNDYYIVEPCCSKKNVYIMKGYGYDMQVITYFELGYPNIICASYNKENGDLTFIESKKGTVFRYPFSVSGRDTTASNDFEDSIVALDWINKYVVEKKYRFVIQLKTNKYENKIKWVK